MGAKSKTTTRGQLRIGWDLDLDSAIQTGNPGFVGFGKAVRNLNGPRPVYRAIDLHERLKAIANLITINYEAVLCCNFRI